MAILGNSLMNLNSNTSYGLPIGDVTEQESRWWAAVLAKGCGWRATLTRGDKEYCPPWACHLKYGEPFTLLHDNPELCLSSEVDPPSSALAQGYLIRLAEMHDVFDQLLAAFTAALTIPSRYQSIGSQNLQYLHG
ncbi:hypothetical protein MGYG_02471 [Nannizzia gypsea CBS 118893]|uniref:Uncharacterized protein n=1 Tax=Arthroderma gypseum (strain ATCC MYA-4604 / CBS 118893) TaxID=535722 RepID=E4UMP3_ARTGP|nr:hypothetical protein MGYG_02471 [Nannizzia gypsea CBS 118893]EFQ99460.1 hypothetical protein MGYG_02471 [Nannizzia gypsea CBS 118893]